MILSTAINYLRSPAMAIPRAALTGFGGTVIGLNIANRFSSRPWVVMAATAAGLAAGILLSQHIQTTVPQPPAPPPPRRPDPPAPAAAPAPPVPIRTPPDAPAAPTPHERLTTLAAGVRATTTRLAGMTRQQLREELDDWTAFPIHRPSVRGPNSYLTPTEVDRFTGIYGPTLRTDLFRNVTLVIEAYKYEAYEDSTAPYLGPFNLDRLGKIATSLRIFCPQNPNSINYLLFHQRLEDLQELINSRPGLRESLQRGALSATHRWVYDAIFNGPIWLRP